MIPVLWIDSWRGVIITCNYFLGTAYLILLKQDNTSGKNTFKVFGTITNFTDVSGSNVLLFKLSQILMSFKPAFFLKI